MEQAPIPAHERTWRHPSELAAAERDQVRAERPSKRLRRSALAVGLIGVGSVCSAAAVTSMVATRNAPTAATPSLPTQAYAPVAARFASTTTVQRAEVPMPPLATPIADGTLAVTTASSMRDVQLGDSVSVRWLSGGGAVVHVTAIFDEVVVVRLDDARQGVAVASTLPHSDDTVWVLADPPFEVRFGDLKLLKLSEATPVVARDGSLVALCTRGIERDRAHVEVSLSLFDDD